MKDEGRRIDLCRIGDALAPLIAKRLFGNGWMLWSQYR